MSNERKLSNFDALAGRDESRGLNLVEAIDAMKAGKSVRFEEWDGNGYNDPDALVFVPGRDVVASFPPMSDLLGAGTEFASADHIDAVFTYYHDGQLRTRVVLGYQFSQREILHAGWQIIV